MAKTIAATTDDGTVNHIVEVGSKVNYGVREETKVNYSVEDGRVSTVTSSL